MAKKQQDEAVRNYLVALKDPEALKDDERISELQRQVEQTDDELERLRLRQEILNAQRPPMEKYEQAFIDHAKEWAAQSGITEQAFQAEGVPARVLRKAGFTTVRAGRGEGGTPSRQRRRTRVSSDDVRAAVPKGVFTIKQVQESTGASAAVVRRVVQEEIEAGRVTDEGSDPDHRGPGRAPRLYKK